MSLGAGPHRFREVEGPEGAGGDKRRGYVDQVLAGEQVDAVDGDDAI